MKKLFRSYLTFLLLGSLLVTASSCDGDDPDPELPKEEVHSARLVLDIEGVKTGYATATYTPGSTPSIELLANKTYVGTLTLFNKAGDDITSEIVAEADSHEVFYEATGGITVTKTDQDSKGRPLGLVSSIKTTNAGQATMKIRLMHQPKKGATSDPTNGETDLDMTVNVLVK